MAAQIKKYKYGAVSAIKVSAEQEHMTAFEKKKLKPYSKNLTLSLTESLDIILTSKYIWI